METGASGRILSWREVFEWVLRLARPALVLARSLASRERPYWAGDPTVRLTSDARWRPRSGSEWQECDTLVVRS
jgi:hypothetical protein